MISQEILLVRPAGFEPTAPGLGILCSILLSYGRNDSESSMTKINDLREHNKIIHRSLILSPTERLAHN